MADMSRFQQELDGKAVQRAGKSIQESFYKEEKRLFLHEAGPSGRWSPLNEKYAKWKRRKYPGKPKMRRTDKLMKSLTSHNEDSILFMGNIGGKFRMKIGTQVEYAIYHQEGSKATHLPVRRVIDPRDPVRLQWIKYIQNEIIKAARKAPFEKGLSIRPGHWDKEYKYVK